MSWRAMMAEATNPYPHNPHNPHNSGKQGSGGSSGDCGDIGDRVSSLDTDTEPHRLWSITLPTGERFTTSYCPPATEREVQSWHPGAKVEPADGVQELHPAALTPADETAVLRWLESIGETDPAIVGETLTRCRGSAEALAYFRGRAGEAAVVLPDAPRYAVWAVTYADGSVEDLVFDPPASQAEVERRRPVALSYRPAETQATQRNMQRNTAATRAHLEATPC